MKQKSKITICKAGTRTAFINDISEVYACEILQKKLGDLRKGKHDMKRILKKKILILSSVTSRARNAIAHIRETCT